MLTPERTQATFVFYFQKLGARIDLKAVFNSYLKEESEADAKIREQGAKRQIYEKKNIKNVAGKKMRGSKKLDGQEHRLKPNIMTGCLV